jgi:hypothetical protein
MCAPYVIQNTFLYINIKCISVCFCIILFFASENKLNINICNLKILSENTSRKIEVNTNQEETKQYEDLAGVKNFVIKIWGVIRKTEEARYGGSYL